MRPKTTLTLPVLAVALAAALAGPAAASTAPSSSAPVARSVRDSSTLYFSSTLKGTNEVGTPGGPVAGDPNASAAGEIELVGSKLTFAFTWKGMPAPTMGHIHTGAAGVNGDVKVPLFTSALPAGTTGAAGVVTVTDPALLAAITAHPSDFYLNLHTTEFPAGAVRSQLTPSRRARPALNLLKGLPLQTLMDGSKEVPAAGDPDGFGIGMVRASGRKITYTLAWSGIGRPEGSHLHLGAAGVSGPVAVPLFSGPVPSTVFAVSGQLRDVDKSLVTTIRHAPTGFYLNLHTAEFPDGAVRGQLYRAGHIGS